MIFFDQGRLWLLAIGDARTPVANLGSLPVADIGTASDAVVLASGPAAVARSNRHVTSGWC